MFSLPLNDRNNKKLFSVLFATCIETEFKEPFIMFKLPILQDSSEDYAETTDKSALISGSSKSYGTENLESTIAIEERLTYTWKEIDVYGEMPTQGSFWSRIGKKFKSCCSNNGKEFVARKHLLKNITGVAHSGELLAV